MNKQIMVAIYGCDDTTYFYYPYSEEAIAHLQQLVDLSIQHSSYGCQPTMGFYVVSQEIANQYKNVQEDCYEIFNKCEYRYYKNGKEFNF